MIWDFERVKPRKILIKFNWSSKHILACLSHKIKRNSKSNSEIIVGTVKERLIQEEGADDPHHSEANNLEFEVSFLDDLNAYHPSATKLATLPDIGNIRRHHETSSGLRHLTTLPMCHSRVTTWYAIQKMQYLGSSQNISDLRSKESLNSEDSEFAQEPLRNISNQIPGQQRPGATEGRFKNGISRFQSSAIIFLAFKSFMALG